MRPRPVVTGAVLALVTTAVLSAPARADSVSWCDDVGGVWNAVGSVCALSVTSNRQATMQISITMPGGLVDTPVAGPTIRGYLRSFVAHWRSIGATIVRDSVASTEYSQYDHSASVKSAVFHEYWKTVGDFHNNAYRTWTFDMADGRPLTFADLFDPAVVPALARPYVVTALDEAPPPHLPDTYPFIASEWEPHADGSGFVTGYDAFALSADELVLFMPGAPMAHPNPIPRGELVWSMDGGTVTAHVPLSALAPAARAPYRE